MKFNELNKFNGFSNEYNSFAQKEMFSTSPCLFGGISR